MTEIYIVEIHMSAIEDLLDMLKEHISSGDKNRILNYMIPQKSYQSLIAEILVRYIIIKKNILHNKDIRIRRNGFGKPYLENVRNFHFNCSHSGNWVVCAVSNDAVGVDIEAIRHIDFNVAKRFFSEKEYAYLEEVDPSFRLSYFYDLWTLKEAYIKKIGKGLSVKLSDFSININENKIYVESTRHPTNCYFYKYDIIENYKISLCTSAYEEKCPIKFIKQDYLINNFLILMNA